MKNISEEKITKLMEALEISREEAIEVIQFDDGELENEEVNEMTEKAKTVDKGEKRGRKVGTKMAGVTQQTRKKKENPTKARVIRDIKTLLEGLGDIDNVEVPNPEKTIMFKIGEDVFEIDLKQKRKPKQ